jgi:cbb3-type cytochrome oxidase subunit 3
MKLSDVMSHAGLAVYAEVALILFFLAFVVVVVRVLRWSNREELDHVSHLPLDDDGDDTHRTGDRA